MVDLRTRYLGMELKNPVIVGACSLTADMKTLEQIEGAGAGAVVIKSLFEEQIQLERLQLENEMEKYSERHAEMITIFPDLTHQGPKEHLYWVKEAKKALNIPVIASLNAVSEATWLEYAKQLADTGADALEVNLYSSPKAAELTATAIEEAQIALIKKIHAAVAIPVAVKLSCFYTNPLHFIQQVDKTGVQAVVLFNRLFQPDIDVSKQKNIFPFLLSDKTDNRLPLRFAGLLFDRITADICSSTGIMDADDLVKMILAGANAVQIVSTLYKNGVGQVSGIINGLTGWMEEHGYQSLQGFRGTLSKKNSTDPWSYERAQYVRLLLHPEHMLDKYPAV